MALRRIGDRIIKAIRERKPLVYKSVPMGYPEGQRIVHDEVIITPGGFRLELIGTTVAELDGPLLRLGCNGYNRATNVTIDRVNLVCDALGARRMLGKHEWADGVPYTGRREFTLESLRAMQTDFVAALEAGRRQ